MSESTFNLGCGKLRYQLAEAERVASCLVRAASRDRFTMGDVDLSAAQREIAYIEKSLAEIKAEIQRASAKELENV